MSHSKTLKGLMAGTAIVLFSTAAFAASSVSALPSSGAEFTQPILVADGHKSHECGDAMKDDAMKDDAMKDDAMKDDAMKDDAMKDDAMKDKAHDCDDAMKAS